MAHAYKSMQHEASIERVMMRSTKDKLGTAEKSGCVSAGRVVASEPRGLQFESIHPSAKNYNEKHIYCC